jgi:prepilin-type N-terminal cleavage/methylation domain-containing protein
MKLIRDQRGMTLTELMAAMLLAVILFGAAVTTFVEFLDVSTRSDNQNRAQDTARTSIDRLAAQLRNAMSTNSTGTNPIESVSDFDLIFLTPLAGTTPNATTNPRGLSHVRYCLKTDVLWVQTTEYNSNTQPTPPTTVNCPNNNWTTKTAVADHVVNEDVAGDPPLFTAKTDTSTPPNVTHIQLHAIVDWNLNKDPDPTELQSTINLRNFNRVPTAAMTCQGLANGHAICDGSGSIDPDGAALQYAWTMDGSTQSETTYRLDKSGLAAHSVHTFVLTITDSGGATSTVTRTVTMP